MEAYKIKRGSKVKVVDNDIKMPPMSINVVKNEIITINQVDGMYCSAINSSGETIYIAAWTEVDYLQ